jgi:hypothetical protein
MIVAGDIDEKAASCGKKPLRERLVALFSLDTVEY